MKVVNQWLDGAVRIDYPAGPAMNIRRFLVMHFTAGASALSSVDFWRTPAAKGAEAHVVIDRDGTVYQLRAFNQKADHAGASAWRCPNLNRVFKGLNACSIGIEYANAGDNAALARKWSKLPLVKARHKNGGPVKEWEAFTPEQVKAGIAVSKAIVEYYNLDDLIGHDDIAPDRKNDPGPAFPMAQFRTACGFPAEIVR